MVSSLPMPTPSPGLNTASWLAGDSQILRLPKRAGSRAEKTIPRESRSARLRTEGGMIVLNP